MAASEPLDDHFARFGERVFSVLREYGQHTAQERILRRAQMVEDVRQPVGARGGADRR